ncbi:MAG TPA: hypothetical protein V6C88_03915 [Chroococcidiopsis sp.]
MKAQVDSTEYSIGRIVERIFSTRRISRADQSTFMSSLLSKNALSDDELEQINKVFDGLRTGLIRVVE